jgi:predicted permease
VRLARLAYRAVLRLAPERLRMRHGAEMEAAFADILEVARRRSGPSVLLAALRGLLDLVVVSVTSRARREAFSRRNTERSTIMIATELRAAIRTFRRQRAATALVLTMLSLGIAATVVVFSLVNELFLKPFPFREPDRLVYLNEKAPRWNLDRTGINFPDFDQWRRTAQRFERMALYASASFNLADEAGAERIAGGVVTFEYFGVLDVAPILGRTFTAEEDRPNAPRVVLISERMWRERLGASQAVLGQTLRLNGVAFQIVGVMPRVAEFPAAALVWVPLRGNPNQTGLSYNYDGLGRLRPGVTVEQAEQDLLQAQAPIWAQRDRDKIVSPFALPLRETFVRDFRSVAAALGGSVVLLLVVACANVAAIMLARAIARRREMGIRLAIGATRWRLLRQLFIENLVLAAAGGAAGVLIGRWALHAVVTAVGTVLPAWVTFDFDLRIAVFAVLIAAATALLFGAAPALHAVRGDLQASMQDPDRGGSTVSPRGRRTLVWLVGAEFALAAVAIVSGGLLVRAYGEVRRTDPGYRPDHALLFSIALPAATYGDGQKRIAFWDRLLADLRATPGVEAAGVISCPPLTCHWGNFYTIEGKPPLAPGESSPVVLSRVASDGYFEAMGLRLEAGRFFEAQDTRAPGAPVVIVNETFARTFWPGVPAKDLLGKRLRFNDDTAPWLSVVGVTHDVKHYGLERPMRPGLYFPVAMLPDRTASLAVIVRTTGDPDLFASTARARVQAIDPSLPLYRVATGEAMLADSLRTRATYSWMLAVFAMLTLVLALGGSYGVTSYLAAQRTREIGIRLALGAQSRDIAGAVVRGSLAAVGIGTAIGLGGAIAGTRALEDLLSGVSPRDPAVLLAAAFALTAAGIAATWIPARRAARTDPMSSLRSAG